MSYETYFPEQRHLLQLTIFRRDRLLPADTSGSVEVKRGAQVSFNSEVARGTAPAQFTIIDVMELLRLRKLSQFERLLHVEVGDFVQMGQLIAGKEQRRKGVRAPFSGRVVHISAGRIILQEDVEPLVINANLSGRVVSVRRNRGAQIEGVGAVVQGVWGNDRTVIGTLHVEPEQGLQTLTSDSLDASRRSALFIARRTLTASLIAHIGNLGIVGVVAPSIEPSLIDQALASPTAILLTEGFGTQRMNSTIYTFLANNQGLQATLDGTLPGQMEARRPELIINVQRSEVPPAPRDDLTLQTNLQVRVTRGDSAGSVGKVVRLPKTPVLLDNGLRVHCAEVELISGDKLAVPLENLEVFG